MYFFSVVESAMLVAASSQALDLDSSTRAVDATHVLYKDSPLDYEVDALSEAFYTLVAFGAAAAAIKLLNRRRKNQHSAKKVAAKLQVESVVAQSQATQRSEMPKLLEQDALYSASVGTAASQSKPTRARASNSRSDIASTRTSAAHTSESDKLVTAIRMGKATSVPTLLDAARARCAASGADAIVVRETAAQHLLSVLRACASHHKFPEALAAYDHTREHIGDGCASMWSLLLYSAVESKQFWRCKELFNNLMCNAVPSNNDFLNMVRCHTHEQDPDGLERTLCEFRGADFKLDPVTRNRALSQCFANQCFDLVEILADVDLCDVAMDIVGYNTILKGFAKYGQFLRCFETYENIRNSGIPKSEVTYGIMLDVCIDAKEFDRAKKVFNDLRSSGLEVNVVHYTTFMKGLVNAGELDGATDLLDEMLLTSTKPDLVTYSTLVKARSDRGEVTEAIKVLERMFRQGIVADAIIFNIVLTGCCASTMSKQQVFHVFNWLRSHGLQTSSTTLSILVKALAKSRSWEAALLLLNDARKNYNVWPEMRLYAQLAQACARTGDGIYAVETYKAMLQAASLQGIKIDDATHERLHRLCGSCGQSSAAAQVHARMH